MNRDELEESQPILVSYTDPIGEPVVVQKSTRRIVDPTPQTELALVEQVARIIEPLQFDNRKPSAEAYRKAQAAIAATLARMETPSAEVLEKGVDVWGGYPDEPDIDVNNIWQAMLAQFREENGI